MKTIAVVFNLLLIAVACWAMAYRYLQPAGEGRVPFMILMLLVPLVNLLTLFREHRKVRHPGKKPGIHFGLTL
jgi:FtsH-binding integral membrane protein